MVRKVGYVVNRILLLAAFIWMAVVSLAALCVTAYYPTIQPGVPLSEGVQFQWLFGADAAWVWASLAVAAITVGVLYLIYRAIRGVSPLVPIIICLVFATLVQLLWIALLDIQQSAFPDTQQLQAAAAAFNAGDYATFATNPVAAEKTGADLYFSLYPFQAGSLLLFSAATALFPANVLLALQVANVAFNTASLACLFWIHRSLFAHRANQALLATLGIGCLPLYLSAVLPYGNSAGLFFALLAFALLAWALSQKETKHWSGWQWAALIGAFAAIAVALIVKNTTTLFLIPMVICMIVYALCQRRVAPLIVALLCAIAVNQVPGLATGAVERQVGSDFGEGMPRVSWIAMGLRDDNPLGMPGWWGFYPAELFWDTNADTAAQSALATESIKESLGKFVGDPAYGATFFGKKLASEWIDPSYQTLYYSSLALQDDGTVNPAPGVYGLIYEPNPLNRAATLFMDGYQLVVYVGAAICVLLLFLRRKPRAVEGLLPTAIFIGFGVYLLWEAKSIYLLPYFVLMLPLAAEGWRAVFHLSRTRATLSRKVNGVEARNDVYEATQGRHERKPGEQHDHPAEPRHRRRQPTEEQVEADDVVLQQVHAENHQRVAADPLKKR